MSHQFSPCGRLARRLLILLILATLIAACGDSNDDSGSSKPKVTAVKIYLEAPQIEYAGIYAAISQGYFEAEQLEVELVFSITESSSTTDNAGVEAVLSGAPIFADMTAETLLTNRQNGNDMVAVLTLYQGDSRSIISNVNRGISTPADLVGKRLLVLPGNETITRVFLQTAGINPDDVTFVLPTPDQGTDALATQIIGGEFDGVVYGIEWAVQLNAIGFPSARLKFIDYGVQSYPNLIVTSRQMINENPEVVQRFVNALLRGLQYSLEQPEAVAAWFVKNYGDQLHVVQLRIQDQAIYSIIPLIQTANSNPGRMTSERWNYLAAALKELNLLDAAVKPSEAYTTQFLNTYYRQ